MFAYIHRFAVNHEDRLLVYCLVNLLTHSPLPDTAELKDSTENYGNIYSFIISKQANYQDKRVHNIVKPVVIDEELDYELLQNLETFFIGVANQFKQN